MVLRMNLSKSSQTPQSPRDFRHNLMPSSGTPTSPCICMRIRLSLPSSNTMQKSRPMIVCLNAKSLKDFLLDCLKIIKPMLMLVCLSGATTSQRLGKELKNTKTCSLRIKASPLWPVGLAVDCPPLPQLQPPFLPR